MGRTVTPGLAPFVEALELLQPTLMTSSELYELAAESGLSYEARAVQLLARDGWLLKTGVKGVWEFAPAALAGPVSRLGEWVTLRAQLLETPDLEGWVTGWSALWLADAHDRMPSSQTVAMPAGVRVPAAIERTYRIWRVTSRRSAGGVAAVDGLPTAAPWRVALDAFEVAVDDEPLVRELFHLVSQEGMDRMREASPHLAHLYNAARLAQHRSEESTRPD